jgi:sugar lactone lactonase YvrE
MKKAISLVLVLVLSLAVVFAFPTASWSQTSEWTVYNTANSGLSYNGVTAIAIDAQGTIWIGTGLWYAHAGGGLAKFDGQSWTVYNTSNSDLPSNDHTDLSIDPQGNVWSATENGYTRFDGENWSVYKTHTGMPGNRGGGAPAFDAEGNAWIGTSGGGLVKFDGINWTVYNTGNSGLPSNHIYSIPAFDAQGNLWIATWGGGLTKFDGANWTVYNMGNSGLPHNKADAFAIDAQWNLWIGTNNGLAKFDGANWTVYNKANSGLPNDFIWDIAVGAQANIWVATNGGLAKFDGKNWTSYNRSNSGLPDNIIYSVAIDAQANVWIGTALGGLAVYRAGAQPTVDFNGDGIVDSTDISMLVDYWHTDELLYDIAPVPFGDGIVDVQDLILLAQHLFEDSRLVAHWALDEAEGDIAFDSAGNNDAVTFGAPLWQPSGGMVDGAIELDGVDDRVIIGSIPNPTEGPFSILAWVKGGAPGQVVLSQRDGVNWLCTDPSEGNLMTELVGVGPLMSQINITDSTWHRISLVWDGSYRTLYVDDIVVAEDTQDSLEYSDGGLYLGCGKAMEPGSFWSGLIDDVRIYNRAVRP